MGAPINQPAAISQPLITDLMGADQTQKHYFNFTCHLHYEVITQFSHHAHTDM